MFSKRIISGVSKYKLTTFVGVTTSSLLLNNESQCVSDDEVKYVNATSLDKKISNVANTFERYMKNPDENKDLILHYKTKNNISVYYPYYKTFQRTNDMVQADKKNPISKVYDPSIGSYPYARIARLTVNAPMDDIIRFVMGDEVGLWNKKSITDYEQLSLLPPSVRLAETGDVEHNIYQPQVNANPKLKSNPSHKTSSTVASSPINHRNLLLTYKQQHLTNSIFGVNNREFYNWLYQAPAGIIGIFDKYTSVCICNIDASSDYSQNTNLDGSKPIQDDCVLLHGCNDSSISPNVPKKMVRGRCNSIMLLENVTPEKVQITFGIELSPNVYYLYNDNQVDSYSNTMSTSLLNDDMVFVSYLSDLKKISEENYANENSSHSIEEAALHKFNKQKQHLESFHLNLKDTTAAVAAAVSNDTIKTMSQEDIEYEELLRREHEELVKILNDSYNRICKDLEQTPDDEDLIQFRDRIFNDLTNAKNKYK